MNEKAIPPDDSGSLTIRSLKPKIPNAHALSQYQNGFFNMFETG